MTILTSRHGFPHQRLDAWHVAQELVEGAVRLTQRCPRGFADLRDQIRRAALATVRHIAEGASRTSPADRRARFVVARGECAECHATLETAARLDLLPASDILRVQVLADRVSAMLTGLVRREERRMASRVGTAARSV
jgi:four helix bundle protein